MREEVVMARPVPHSLSHRLTHCLTHCLTLRSGMWCRSSTAATPTPHGWHAANTGHPEQWMRSPASSGYSTEPPGAVGTLSHIPYWLGGRTSYAIALYGRAVLPATLSLRVAAGDAARLHLHFSSMNGSSMRQRQSGLWISFPLTQSHFTDSGCHV